MIDLPMQAMPRDVRIAKALLEYLATPSTLPGSPLQIAFTMYEEDCEVMDDVCKAAHWEPRNWKHMRTTLSAVASRLASWRYLTRHEVRHNQEAMEQGEPRKWYVYELPYKYRARFNPDAWPNYRPEWSPEDEMAYLLRRVFDFEAGAHEHEADPGGVGALPTPGAQEIGAAS